MFVYFALQEARNEASGHVTVTETDGCMQCTVGFGIVWPTL